MAQIDGFVHHIGKVRNLLDDMKLRANLSTDVHPDCLKKHTLRKLMRSPGACDILQAIVRRAIMPIGTKLSCCRCTEPATIQHVLLSQHQNEACPASNYFSGEMPSIRELVRAFASGDAKAFRFVCTRIVLYLDDRLAQLWATRLLAILNRDVQ